MSGEIPKTRTCASIEEQIRLKAVIRSADVMGGRISSARVAQPDDAEALADLLGDPSIGPRIYTLPNPIDRLSMTRFIEDHLEEKSAGVGVLFVSFDAAGAATAYFDVQVWPQWSAAKFGGAVKSERQGRGFGGLCGLAAMEWCFDTLGVSLVCETTARDNDRSIQLLRRLGMTQLGEVISTRPDGSTRPSLYWELSRRDWMANSHARRINPRPAANAQSHALSA